MLIPNNIIANADDLGYSAAVNKGILYCFDQGYINSTSLMTNMPFFKEAVDLIHENPSIHHIGLHIDLGEGKPVTNFAEKEYLDDNGNFDFYKVNRPFNILNAASKAAFSKEIDAQINKALTNNISIDHMDSHCHFHTLPGFYKLFLDAAKRYKLKVRLAQTYNEGSYIKYAFRKYINNYIKKNDLNYSDNFETVEHFLKSTHPIPGKNKITEIMLHPYIDDQGLLKDHLDEATLRDWLIFLDSK